MLTISSLIQARLATVPELALWAVRLDTEPEDRSLLPVIDIGIESVKVKAIQGAAAQLSTRFSVRLTVERSATASGDIDMAHEYVITALHNWQPVGLDGRFWQKIIINAIETKLETNTVTYSLIFDASAVYKGHIITR